MSTDPLIAWGIALVVATIYGWVMHSRGFNKGVGQMFGIVTGALEHKKIMTKERLIEHMQDYEEAVIASEQDEEE